MVEGKTVRFLLTNDGSSLLAIDDPVSVEHLQKQVDMLVGTQVDTLCWNLGISGAYRYDTRASTRWGQGLDKMARAEYFRVKENLESLLRQGVDPLRVVLDRGREKGIKVYPSIRIYDCQLGACMDPMNRDHPEWQIKEQPRYGPAADRELPTYPQQLDHVHPEVRQRTVQVVEEMLDRYGVQGIELDFNRRPHYFKPDEAERNHYLMTDMVRRIRASAVRTGKAFKRPVEVVCRVPAVLSDCRHLGLDVATWVREGLIDTIIPTNFFFFSLDYPFQEFGALVENTPVQMVVSFCPVLERVRGNVPPAAGEPVSPDVAYVITKETWYAAAQVAYAQGAHGLATFNLSLPARMGSDWDRRILNEIANPAFVARQDKLYPYITGESLNRPTRLGREPVSYNLYSAEDPSTVSSTTLQVFVTQTTTRDRLTFKLNGQALEVLRRLTKPDFTGGLQPPHVDPHHVYEAELGRRQVRKGVNRLAVRLDERNPEVDSPMTVVGVNIVVRHR